MTTDALAPGFARATPAATPADSTYVTCLDLLRGVAILAIVMLHAGNAFFQQGLADRTPGSALGHAINLILFHDSTLYFSLISGVLYGHLFWRRPHGAFFKARLRNIGSPYLVVSFVLTALAWAIALRRDGGSADISAFVRELAVNIATGDAWNTLWYIPVILGLYAISPLLSRLVRGARWRWLAALLILAPLLISRTGTVLTPEIVVYFGGAYVYGLVLGTQLDLALDGLRKHWRWFCAAALIATAALTLLFAINVDRVGITSLRESCYYVQRLSIASLLLVALSNWSTRPPSMPRKLLGVAASMSFGIYFVHGPLLRPIARVIGPMVPADQPWWALLGGAVATSVAGLAASVALVALVRLVFGKRSRLVIGS